MVKDELEAALEKKLIAYEDGNVWVGRDTAKDCYIVYVAGLTHSVSDSAYPLDTSGLSVAIARAKYLANFLRGRHQIY